MKFFHSITHHPSTTDISPILKLFPKNRLHNIQNSPPRDLIRIAKVRGQSYAHARTRGNEEAFPSPRLSLTLITRKRERLYPLNRAARHSPRPRIFSRPRISQPFSESRPRRHTHTLWDLQNLDFNSFSGWEPRPGQFSKVHARALTFKTDRRRSLSYSPRRAVFSALLLLAGLCGKVFFFLAARGETISSFLFVFLFVSIVRGND